MSEAAPVDVRHARAADLRQLADVEEDGGFLLVEYFGEAAAGVLGGPATPGRDRLDQPGFVLVAGEPVVGFAHVVYVEGWWAHLQQLVVRRAAGAQGIGTALVRTAMEEARWAGYDRLSLITFRDVPFNAAFYRSLGFTDVARLEAFQRDLRRLEQDMGLDEIGARVVMDVALERHRRME